MKILISEYITSGALSDKPMPSSLQQEGLLMLTELVRLCRLLNDVEPIITLDHRIDYCPDDIEMYAVSSPAEYRVIISNLISQCDAGWVVAPESNEILYQNIEWFERSGLRTMNCSLQAIRVCADKYESAKQLAAAGVAMIPTGLLGSDSLKTDRWVVKPRFGVGCERIKEMTPVERDDFLRHVDHPNAWIEQPFIEGNAASLSLFAWNQRLQILSYNEQHIERDSSGYRLTACTTNAKDISEQMYAVVDSLAGVLPGLRGYFGVDIIETSEQILVVEMNPRLTTSAVGLFDATGINVVELAIASMQSNEMKSALANKNQPVVVKLS